MPIEIPKAIANPNTAPDVKSVAPILNSNATCSYNGVTSTPQTFSGTWPTYFEARNEIGRAHV